MRYIERKLFPERVKRREAREQIKADDERREEEARLTYRNSISNSKDYLSKLPFIENSEVVTLDEEMGTRIQMYSAPRSSQTVLLVPGYGSTGQSRKYDWLIADLLRNGVSVVRANNEPKINIRSDEYDSNIAYVSRHQELYKRYMEKHLKLISMFMSDNGIISSDKNFHIIASSAGATAVLALHGLFDVSPESLILLGPSGDIAKQDAISAAEAYIAERGEIQMVVGQFDGFQNTEPFTSLAQMSGVNASRIAFADHELRDPDKDGGFVQIGLHREIFKTIHLPYEQFDLICSGFQYVKAL